MPDEPRFSLCLTHDIDRPYKSFRSLYYAVRDRRLSHLKDLLPGRNPYWQFDDIMSLESDLGVRSAFYVLNEPKLREKRVSEWFRPSDWIQYLGGYDIKSQKFRDVLVRLRDGGWEIGLHGSFRSYRDVERLYEEKQILEDCLESPVVGGRQHYLNLEVPETWKRHTDIGLRYDASLGSNDRYGFNFGYQPIRPFNDEFVVFPLTVMEQALPDPGTDFEAAWSTCEDLLEEAAENQAVMTVLWHPRFFSESDFPGYRTLYVRLVERALEMGAWVGPPVELYRKLNQDGYAAVSESGSNDETPKSWPGPIGCDDEAGIESVGRDGRQNHSISAE